MKYEYPAHIDLQETISAKDKNGNIIQVPRYVTPIQGGTKGVLTDRKTNRAVFPIRPQQHAFQPKFPQGILGSMVIHALPSTPGS